MNLNDLRTGHLYSDVDGDVFVYCGGTVGTYLDLGDGERFVATDLDHNGYPPFSIFTGTVTVTPAA